MCATLQLRSFSRKNVSLSASSLFRSFFSKFVVEISLCYSFWNLRLWLRWKLRTSNAAVKNRLRYKWTNSGSKLDGPFSLFNSISKLLPCWKDVAKDFSKRVLRDPLKGAQLFNGPELVIQITNYSNNQIFELGSHHFNETHLIYWSLSQKS